MDDVHSTQNCPVLVLFLLLCDTLTLILPIVLKTLNFLIVLHEIKFETSSSGWKLSTLPPVVDYDTYLNFVHAH